MKNCDPFVFVPLLAIDSVPEMFKIYLVTRSSAVAVIADHNAYAQQYDWLKTHMNETKTTYNFI